jgi:hypothetical protein
MFPIIRKRPALIRCAGDAEPSHGLDRPCSVTGWIGAAMAVARTLRGACRVFNQDGGCAWPGGHPDPIRWAACRLHVGCLS